MKEEVFCINCRYYDYYSCKHPELTDGGIDKSPIYGERKNAKIFISPLNQNRNYDCPCYKEMCFLEKLLAKIARFIKSE